MTRPPRPAGPQPTPHARAPAAALAAALLVLAAGLAALATPALAAQGDAGGGGGAAGEPVELHVEARNSGGDFAFAFEGVEGENPTVSLPAGATVVVHVTNAGTTIHNFHVADEAVAECTAEPALSQDACATALLEPGQEATLEFTVAEDAPESFRYWCDPHLQQGMRGEFTTVAAAQGAPPLGANVTIESPEANSTVPVDGDNATVTAEVNVTGLNLTEAFAEGAANESGEGHVHYWLRPAAGAETNGTCFRLADDAANLTEAVAAGASGATVTGGNASANASLLLNDTARWVNTASTTLNITGVPPGEYVLCVELATNAHQSLTPPAYDAVAFQVGEGAQAAEGGSDAAATGGADDAGGGGEGGGDAAGAPYVG